MALLLASYIVRTRGRGEALYSGPLPSRGTSLFGTRFLPLTRKEPGIPFFRIGVVPEPAIFEFFLYSQVGPPGASILGFYVPQLSSHFSPANADVAVAAIIATVTIVAATKVALLRSSIHFQALSQSYALLLPFVGRGREVSVVPAPVS
jgi:hypothetical protein